MSIIYEKEPDTHWENELEFLHWKKVVKRVLVNAKRKSKLKLLELKEEGLVDFINKPTETHPKASLAFVGRCPHWDSGWCYHPKGFGSGCVGSDTCELIR